MGARIRGYALDLEQNKPTSKKDQGGPEDWLSS